MEHFPSPQNENEPATNAVPKPGFFTKTARAIMVAASLGGAVPGNVEGAPTNEKIASLDSGSTERSVRSPAEEKAERLALEARFSRSFASVKNYVEKLPTVSLTGTSKNELQGDVAKLKNDIDAYLDGENTEVFGKAGAALSEILNAYKPVMDYASTYFPKERAVVAKKLQNVVASIARGDDSDQIKVQIDALEDPFK